VPSSGRYYIRELSIAPPEITAIVCTCDRDRLLERAVDSLLAQSLPRERFEILVVNNGGGSPRVPEGVRLLREPRPGLSHARNLGVERAGGRTVAFLDDDAVAGPAWLERIVDAFRRDAGVACVGGRVEPLFEGARPAWLPDALLGYFSIVDLGDRPRVVDTTRWLAGTNIAFDRQALLDVGGFSPRLGRRPGTLLGMEEVSVVRRMRRRGLRVLYDPAVVVAHEVPASRMTRRWLHRRAWWQGISDAVSDRDDLGAGERWLHLAARAAFLLARPWPLVTAALPLRATPHRVLAECRSLARAGYLAGAGMPRA
jgi:GT2 family glycosyltransferase